MPELFISEDEQTAFLFCNVESVCGGTVYFKQGTTLEYLDLNDEDCARLIDEWEAWLQVQPRAVMAETSTALHGASPLFADDDEPCDLALEMEAIHNICDEANVADVDGDDRLDAVERVQRLAGREKVAMGTLARVMHGGQPDTAQQNFWNTMRNMGMGNKA